MAAAKKGSKAKPKPKRRPAKTSTSGNKSVAMLPQKDLLPLTGYLRGGCSPIGMKKAFHTYIDSAAI